MPQLHPDAFKQGNRRPVKLQTVVKTPVVFTDSWSGQCIATYTGFSQEDAPLPPYPKLPPCLPQTRWSPTKLSKSASCRGGSPNSPASTRQSSSAKTFPGDVNGIRTVTSRLAVPPPRQTLRRHIRRQIEAVRPSQRQDDAIRIYRALDLPRHARGDKKFAADGVEQRLFIHKRLGDGTDVLRKWMKVSSDSSKLRSLNSETDLVKILSTNKSSDISCTKGDFLSHREPISNISDFSENANSFQLPRSLGKECDKDISSSQPLKTDKEVVDLNIAVEDRLTSLSPSTSCLDTGYRGFTPEHLLEGLVRQLEDAGGASRKGVNQGDSRYSWVPLSICSL